MNSKEYFDKQLSVWADTRQRYDDLRSVQVREMRIEGSSLTLKAQFNPARIVSTGAKIDKATITRRPCFLCRANRPKEQLTTPICQKMEFLVNPFPILPMHFTIPSQEHQPQLIRNAYTEMYQILDEHQDLMVFYNGPKCGASCPDHLHLQAGTSGIVPLQSEWDTLEQSLQCILSIAEGEDISLVSGYVCPAILIRSHSLDSYTRMFNIVYDALPMQEDDTEPMMNIIAWRKGDETMTVVIPRKKHRPACYPDGTADKGGQYLISPGAIDMAGLLITPREDDFVRLTANEAAGILKEVCLDDDEMQIVMGSIGRTEAQQPVVTVGIVSGEEIHFRLNTPYSAKGITSEGEQVVRLSDGRILWNGNHYNIITFTPNEGCRASFTLHDVTIGVNFHWERKEEQTFEGELRFIIHEGKVCAINRLKVEDYLTSVISSEMSATSSLELLKAHAVISRSWLLAQIRREKRNDGSTELRRDGTTELRRDGSTELRNYGITKLRKSENPKIRKSETPPTHIRWYDREDHTAFDVCADDHCQRYQGITKASSPYVREAIAQTYGEVLTYGAEICDARFSKCCGGVTEEYRYCWENINKPYLASVNDPYCNTNDREILTQVLNDYDQETNDFYTWDVRITKQRVCQLLKEKLHLDLGSIVALEPMERGKSGRISRLKFIGTERSVVIGKELEIRRALSDSHLYSSAFDVEDDGDAFILHGKGWGHGVGLCQIGAAVMGAKGFKYDDILLHYYRNAKIVRLY